MTDQLLRGDITRGVLNGVIVADGFRSCFESLFVALSSINFIQTLVPENQLYKPQNGRREPQYCQS